MFEMTFDKCSMVRQPIINGGAIRPTCLLLLQITHYKLSFLVNNIRCGLEIFWELTVSHVIKEFERLCSDDWRTQTLVNTCGYLNSGMKRSDPKAKQNVCVSNNPSIL